jgi:hypothetical protein
MGYLVRYVLQQTVRTFSDWSDDCDCTVGAFSVPAINLTMTVGHNVFDCDCIKLMQIAIFHWIVSVLMGFFPRKSQIIFCEIWHFDQKKTH